MFDFDQFYYIYRIKKNSPDGIEPSTFRLTAERANQLRHGDIIQHRIKELPCCIVDYMHV